MPFAITITIAQSSLPGKVNNMENKLLRLNSPEAERWPRTLRVWNLKYDDFPMIEVVENMVAFTWYQSGEKRDEILEFETPEMANEFHAKCSDAEKQRADAFWGVQG
jgi:hypothetical protein